MLAGHGFSAFALEGKRIDATEEGVERDWGGHIEGGKLCAGLNLFC
jgi:hypothetical protein